MCSVSSDGTFIFVLYKKTWNVNQFIYEGSDATFTAQES
jgi:hypothetical protein